MTVGKAVNRQVSVRRHNPNSTSFILLRNIAPNFTAFVITYEITEAHTVSHLYLRRWYFTDIGLEYAPLNTTLSYFPTHNASSTVIRACLLACDALFQRTMWSANQNRVARSIVNCLPSIENSTKRKIRGSDMHVRRAADVSDVKPKLSLRDWRFYLVHGNTYFHYY